MDKTNNGMFITFEGPEGSGKTTQINQLDSYLSEMGYSVVSTREPGGTGVGCSIREILLNPDLPPIQTRTELLLFLADRAQHVQEVILPSLAMGKIVLCDRYTDSTVAYQVGGRDFSEELIVTLNEFSSYSVVPDLTFMLDVDYKIGIKRATRNFADRFEKEKKSFHDKIRKKYHEIAKNNPDRMVVIDTTVKSIVDIQDIIRSIITEKKILR
ncbi:MAG: dTMP kinase [Candidatus Margulisbacteria bacterium GWF2_35_9]|nr:MAG: dTMP kinase [Candidatus Margulisbacteria bacterium GWF2_35_9]